MYIFFTNEVIKIGKIKLSYEESHREFNGVLYKLCNKCFQWYPCTDEYFYKTNSKNPDGLMAYCKKCNKEKALKWQYNNYDHWKEIVAVRDATPEKRDKTRELARIQREKGYFKEYQQNNRDKIQQYGLKRANKNHTISKEEWIKCKEYFDNSCAYCGISEDKAKIQQGQYLHKEHVEHEGTSDLSNCVPSCKSCNSQKWEFKLEDWYNEDNPIFNQERLDKILKWLNEDWKKY